MYKKNLYKVFLCSKGYVRTKNNLSGNVEFSKMLDIEAFSKKEAYNIAISQELSCLKSKENFIYECSQFFIDFDKDEIVRDDTELLYFEPIIEFMSYRNFINDFNKKINFILNFKSVDLKPLRKELYLRKQYDIGDFKLKDIIWDILDNKYFLEKKVRFDIESLNLNKIKPKTYFDKDLKELPSLSYFDKTFSSSDEIINFLNDIIKNKEILFKEKKIIHAISNNKKRKLEKNKRRNDEIEFEKILFESKKEFLKILNTKLEKAKLTDFQNEIVFVLKRK